MRLRLPSLLAGNAFISFILACSPTQAEPKAPLRTEEFTNGSETLAPLTGLQQKLAASTALLMNQKEQPLATITWVGEDGYFITKASEAPHLEDSLVFWDSGKKAAVREIRREIRYDLVLGQAVHVTGVKPAQFVPSKSLSLGQWIVAPAKASRLKIGVISAQRRSIKGFGAAIGVRMDDRPATKEGTGVRILGIAEDSPAATAGLRANDVVLELAGEKVREHRRVNEIISKRQPGEEIDVKIKREGKERNLQVRLASRTKILANWDGEDFANGGISIRTDNFSEVLQHDLPLNPLDMGGPLMNLQGEAVGINIARVDRVTTFALPSEVFWPTIDHWIETDRHPPKALPSKSEDPPVRKAKP